MLFDAAESRHLRMQVVSLAVSMSEKPKSGAVIWWWKLVWPDTFNACARNVYVQLFTKWET